MLPSYLKILQKVRRLLKFPKSTRLNPKRIASLAKSSVARLLLFSVPGIIAGLMTLEIIVRLVVDVSDAPDIKFDPVLGNIFIPSQQGIYIKGKNSEIRASFRINNDGWNSPHEYRKDKTPDVYRLAVIGDSFIEALQVDYDKSYPYLLENGLSRGKLAKKIEVYTFGHSGANLLHYAHILDMVGKEYQPNLVIVNIVANDFLESLYDYSRKDNWSLKYANEFFEKPPQKVSNLGFKQMLRRSALVRFLTINLDVINTSPLFSKLFYAETRRNEATGDAHQTLFTQNEFRDKLLDYILTQYLDTSHKYGFRLLLVVDANRQAIYANQDPTSLADYRLTMSTKAIAQKLGIPMVDLLNPFVKAWNTSKTRFDWEIDEHWNSYGHETIARAVQDWLIMNPQGW